MRHVNRKAENSNGLDSATPDRRQWLARTGCGFGLIGLAGMLQDQGLLGRAAADDLGARALQPLAEVQSHFPARAKRVIWLFINGGPSQVDTWDYKPELARWDGKTIKEFDPGFSNTTGFFKDAVGNLMKSPFEFTPRGDCGKRVSEIFPHLGAHVDKMTFIHSMFLRSNNHAPASIELMCGSNVPGRPAAGAWATYGLGTVNQDLPAYVVMHGKRPRGDNQIWSAGFMPKTYQAMTLDAQRQEAIDDIARAKNEQDAEQRAALLTRYLGDEVANERVNEVVVVERQLIWPTRSRRRVLERNLSG